MESAVTHDNRQEPIKRRLWGVPGDGDKVNDVYAFGRLHGCTEHIVFFGGDIQDYEANMQQHSINKTYIRWSTENTAQVLHRKFPSSLVFVIRPTRMHLQSFAVYANFFHTDDYNPKHNRDFGAIRHLFLLYSATVKQLYSGNSQSTVASSLPVRLIGFSKGCSVVNQIVLELHLLDQNPQLKHFVSWIKAFYWLDGGHAGGQNTTWVTDDDSLRRLAALDSQIFVHVTPYQIRDPEREWIGPQEIQFFRKLLGFSAKIQEYVHFQHEHPSLTNHFKVLEIF